MLKNSDKKENKIEINKNPPLKRLTGVGFYMIVALAIIKDLIDIPANLSIIFSVLTIFTGLIISFVIWFYLFYNDVSFITKFGSKKLVILVTSFIIETVPFINILPVFTFTLFLIRSIENHEKLKEFNEKLVKLKII